MLSYWERQSFTRYDHIIVGGGLTGISLAIELQEAFPDARIIVLERSMLPTGATTRNAGFACMGSAGEILADLETQSEEAVVGLFVRRRDGLRLLRTRLSDEALGYRANGGFELLSGKDAGVMDRLDYLNALLRPQLGQNAFQPANHRIAELGFSSAHVAAMVANTCEGSIDSGRTMRSLLALAASRGVEIRTGAAVVRYEEDANGVDVLVEAPFRRELIPLRGQTMSICTNAFAGSLLPGEDVVPGRGQVLVTMPVPGLRFRGVFHYDSGYYYFRDIDGRVLIGGGRNLDFDGERTTDNALSEAIQADLVEKLRTMILPGQDFEVDMRWSGIMAFGAAKWPVVRAFSPRVFGAFRMGGMGVALGSGAARELAALIRAGIS